MGCELSVIESNRCLCGDVYLMRTASPEICGQARPGQFLHVRVSEGIHPLLRRPFCIHRIDPENGALEILYRVTGEGTAALARMSSGTHLDILGPLGNGFTIDDTFSQALIIAGGMGIAPMFFLLDELTAAGKSVTLLWGAAAACEIFVSPQQMAQRQVKMLTASEDGKTGHHGYVTDLVPQAAADIGDLSRCRAFVCGPVPMLRAVQRLIARFQVPCEASLEERMACGIGVCAGCSVKTTSGDHKLVCKDGPVMDLMEIAYNG